MDEKKIEEKVEVKVVKDPKNFRDLWFLIDARLTEIEKLLAERSSNGRGPKSTRSMTKEDAIKIMTGAMKDETIKKCATDLGLSYGQVYSARNGYTFKEQYAARKKMYEDLSKKTPLK